MESVFDLCKPDETLDTPALLKIVQQRAPVYDKDREGHYNLISALHKSLRGSDTDAALYWAARMLQGGEDPLYLLRRLTRFAMEDISLADPAALQMAIAAWDTYERLGSPEGELRSRNWSSTWAAPPNPTAPTPPGERPGRRPGNTAP